VADLTTAVDTPPVMGGYVLVSMAIRSDMVRFGVDVTIPKMIASVALGAYLNQAIFVPNRTASLARAYATRRGGPLLSFAPPPGVHLKSAFIKSCVGDVNLHHSAPRGPMGVPGRTVFANPYQLPFQSGSFAALFSYGTLERLQRPDTAILEWQRVAERVFVVVPQFWMPECWFNDWYISGDLRRAWPLWTNQSRVIWLPPARRRAYDAGTCRTQPQTPMTRSPSPSPPPQTVQAPPGPASNESSVQDQLSSLPIVRLIEASTPQTSEEDFTPEEESSASPQQHPTDQPYLPDLVGSPSSTSVSSMMIMSGPDSEDD
jgi:hypothetical protein